MEQIRAINALEPFLLLSKSATSPRAAADLIIQATSSPNTYVFANLLQTPNIQALKTSTEYSSQLSLLEIFSYGTWQDYQSIFNHFFKDMILTNQESSNLPKLSEAQRQKLLLLSLLPLARDTIPLSYTVLQSALSLPSFEELEQLVISAIYADLIDGSLDPSNQLVHIHSVAPLRDLQPGSIPSLCETYEEWSQQCVSMLDDLQKEMDLVDRKAKAKAVRDKRIQDNFEAKVNVNEDNGKGKRTSDGQERGGEEGDEDVMDVDDMGGKTRSKRSLFGGGRKLG